MLIVQTFQATYFRHCFDFGKFKYIKQNEHDSSRHDFYHETEYGIKLFKDSNKVSYPMSEMIPCREKKL